MRHLYRCVILPLSYRLSPIMPKKWRMHAHNFVEKCSKTVFDAYFSVYAAYLGIFKRIIIAIVPCRCPFQFRQIQDGDSSASRRPVDWIALAKVQL